MTKTRWILTIAAGVVALIGGAAAISPDFRFILELMAAGVYADITHPRDPVTRQLDGRDHENGKVFDMMSKPFSPGADKTVVEKQLLDTGFKVDDEPLYAEAAADGFPDDSRIYVRRTPGAASEDDYKVIVGFDPRGHLARAVGSHAWTCI